jgi:hypothetical protein
MGFFAGCSIRGCQLVSHWLSVIGLNLDLLGLQPEEILFSKKRLNP